MLKRVNPAVEQLAHLVRLGSRLFESGQGTDTQAWIMRLAILLVAKHPRGCARSNHLALAVCDGAPGGLQIQPASIAGQTGLALSGAVAIEAVTVSDEALDSEVVKLVEFG